MIAILASIHEESNASVNWTAYVSIRARVLPVVNGLPLHIRPASPSTVHNTLYDHPVVNVYVPVDHTPDRITVPLASTTWTMYDMPDHAHVISRDIGASHEFADSCTD
jgi:hypothetical protein